MKKKRLLAVIHVVSLNQTMSNAKIAFENGADGIFLINHHISAAELFEIFYRLRPLYPRKWIGLNALDLAAGSALRQTPRSADGLWVDSPRLLGSPPGWHFWQYAREFAEAREQFPELVAECFVGFAFKGQQDVGDLDMAARAAAPYLEVVTTSGEATGRPPSVEKLRTIREAIGDEKRLALASGTTVDNVSEFLPFVDDFLVATGIGRNFTELDPPRVRKLGSLIHGYQP